MKRILIVGGTGFIGYNFAKVAIEKKFQVTSISLKKPRKERYLNDVKYIFVDLENYQLLKKKIKGDFEYVVNVGGYGRHMPFSKGGDVIFKSHYFGLKNLIKVISKKKLKRFVQIGSSAEYGSSLAPQHENSNCSPTTPYALAKFMSTNYLIKLHKMYKFPVVILRLFSVYGLGQDKNKVIPQIITGCIKNDKFSVSEGMQYRDFCFVSDIVNAIFLSLSSKNVNGEIFNVGSGESIQIKKLVKLFCKVIGKGKPQFGKIKYRENENMKLYPNIKKIKSRLKWKPKIKLINGLNIILNTIK